MDKTDTRLLRVGTHDALVGSVLFPSGAGFSIDLGNVINQIQSNVIGFSVESCGFYNVASNVYAPNNALYVQTNFGTATITIAPGFYTDAQLLAALNAQLTIVYAGDVVATLTALPQQPRYVLTAAGVVTSIAVWGYGYSTNNSRLSTQLGFTPNTVSSNGTLVLQAANCYDLRGEKVAYLHSDALHFNKHSIDGEGIPIAFSCSFPITVEYGEFNLSFPNQYQKATVQWDETHQVRDINFRLRNLFGELIDLQGTEWFVVLRLFLIAGYK
jgi:hypothetical protein